MSIEISDIHRIPPLLSSAYIANEFLPIDMQSRDVLEVLNKSTGKPITQCQIANEEDIKRALLNSQKAFKEYSQLTIDERIKNLTHLYELIKARKQIFSELICLEAGKPISYAITEVERSLKTLKYTIEECKKLETTNTVLELKEQNRSGRIKLFPRGPVLCISPFNFPLNLALHKVGPALASGNSLILKIPPQTPLTLILLSQLISKLSLPKGTFQSFLCHIKDAETLVKSDILKTLSFTGSDKVGWHLKNICSKKKISLELGGNGAVIIDKDSATKSVAQEVAKSAYLYAGQICISTQRIYVHETIFASFKDLLIKEIKKLNIGAPSLKETIIGPLIDSKSLSRIQEWLNEAYKEGADPLIREVIVGYNTLGPSLLTNTKDTMKIVQEEVFGPVAIIEPFRDIHHAISLVNQSRFGLQAGLYTQNNFNIDIAYRDIQVGGLIINSPPAFREDSMPYGGVKDSGIGREGPRYAIEEMSEKKLLIF